MKLYIPEIAKFWPNGIKLLIEYLNVFSFQGVVWGNSLLNWSNNSPAFLLSTVNPLMKESDVFNIDEVKSWFISEFLKEIISAEKSKPVQQENTKEEK